jgi:hypothetical protein
MQYIYSFIKVTWLVNDKDTATNTPTHTEAILNSEHVAAVPRKQVCCQCAVECYFDKNDDAPNCVG